MANEMSVTVRLDGDDMKNLTKVMSQMKPTDADGRVRSITMPDAIREALRQAAGRK